jgi:uncharacterized membrane protein YuzA (DUF378 family)
MKTLHMVGWWLVVIGAINWGLIGLSALAGSGANWNVVNLLLGGTPMIEAVVYVLVGLSGLWLLADKFGMMKK